MVPNFKFLNDQTDIAVGVSGGGDSMALTHMLCEWAVTHDKTIHALTVDHNLRDDSASEAVQVAAWMNNFPNLKHEILRWDFDEKPGAAVMERARQSRYELMGEYCQAHDIQTLCIAHHADDQAETVLFRLAKGSGLDGLCAMSEIMQRSDMQVYRPLLQSTHDELIRYCIDHDLKWIEDPSNQNTDYARPRLRQALADEGLDAKRLSKTVERLQRGKEALDWMVDEAIKTIELGDHTYQWDILKTYPIDIQIRVLNKILLEVGQTTSGYPPKLERVEEVVTTLKPSNSATLYGCMITRAKDGKTLAIKRGSA